MRHLIRLFGRGVVASLLTLVLGTGVAQAATVNVTSVVDEADGSCADGDCSLRDAVSDALPGDTVAVPAGTYVLTLGRIEIEKDLTVAGAGARATIVNGNAASQVFSLQIPSVVALFSDLTVSNGLAAGTGRGGGIENRATLTLVRCIITNNRAFNGAGISNGGGSTLLVRESAIVGNHTTGNSGGGIVNGGDLTLINSTVSGNSAFPGSVAGGTGPGGAGGVRNSGFFIPVTFTAVNSTIAANSSDPGTGGGITNFAVNVSLINTIVAGNTGGDCLMEFAVTQTSEYSLDSDDSCGLTGPGDLPGVAPLLGPLADNGGPTDTHALLASSPALDAGNSDVAVCPATDQRGVTRPQGPGCDIGAFELDDAPQPPDCSNATASPNLLWPPNHEFVSIQISGIVNPVPGAVTVSVTSIFQDEPVQSPGSGNTSPDATGVGTANPSVRAERDGGFDGRVYHIAFTATGAGGSCMGTVTVGVPKSQGINGGPVDQGALYDSTLP